MKVKSLAVSTCILWGVFASYALAQMPLIVESPDGAMQVELIVKQGKLTYSVQYQHETFLESSPLGLETSIGDFSSELKFVSDQHQRIQQSYTLNRAKVSQVDYLANQLSARFSNANGDFLDVTFQVSDHDIAFRYGISSSQDATRVTVMHESTGFNLPDAATTFITPQALPMTGWMQTKPSYEEPYTYDAPMEQPSLYGQGYTFPALFKNEDKGWLLISETGVDGHYVGGRLSEGNKQGLYKLQFPQAGENGGIGEVTPFMALPATTPWRTITLGNTLTPIVESTVSYDVVAEKYAPSTEYKMGRATWSWIVWQDKSINYNDQISFIDLAAQLGFEYVLIDNWWDSNIGYENMEKLVAYAASKQVSVLLWYNSNGWWNDAPQTPQDKMNTSVARKQEMAWMQRIGVKGIKVDFFGGDKQLTMQLYEDILTDANDFGLGVTFHGCTLPRGWERMYPNFVTSEAVLASENLVFRQDALDLHAYNATILPFTRNAVAAMDFAPVFLNQRLSRTQEQGSLRTTTDTFELATSVLYLSPIQHFGLTPNNLNEQPKYVLDFLRNVPTVWDETRLIDGYPGQFVVMARRKGTKWYVVAVNGEKKAKTLQIKLPMLANQTITMLSDKEDKGTQQTSKTLPEDGSLTIPLMSEGGLVLYQK